MSVKMAGTEQQVFASWSLDSPSIYPLKWRLIPFDPKAPWQSIYMASNTSSLPESLPLRCQANPPIFPFNPPPLWELWAELTPGIWSLDLYRFCQTKHEFALLHTYMWVTEREKAAKADLVPFSWSEPPAIRLSP